jgi:hypothetical protein
MPRQELLARIDAQIDQIKQGERPPGVDELLVPGERGERRRLDLVSRGAVPLRWRAGKSSRDLRVARRPAASRRRQRGRRIFVGRHAQVAWGDTERRECSSGIVSLDDHAKNASAARAGPGAHHIARTPRR